VPANRDIAAVIVNYRSYDELSAALAALRSEKVSDPVEIVVVDQESDASRAKAVQARFPNITFIENPRNDGFAAGVNRGARETTARYLIVLNPDTVVQPGLIEKLASWLDTHADAAVVGPRILNIDGTIQPSARRFPDITTGLGGRMSFLTQIAPDNWLSRRNLEWSRASEPVQVDWVSGACMMIRRSAFEQVGGFDNGFFLYWEDADLCRRLRTAGLRTYYVPTVVAVHEGSRASRHAASRSIVAFHRSAFRYYWKHGGPIARVFAPAVKAVLWSRMMVKRARLGRQA
jgi:N-acetylglucosaminyl-diphospho-decaprenol L-rhamnosyltransferase